MLTGVTAGAAGGVAGGGGVGVLGVAAGGGVDDPATVLALPPQPSNKATAEVRTEMRAKTETNLRERELPCTAFVSLWYMALSGLRVGQHPTFSDTMTRQPAHALPARAALGGKIRCSWNGRVRRFWYASPDVNL